MADVITQSGYNTGQATKKIIIKDDVVTDAGTGIIVGSNTYSLNSLDFVYNGQKGRARFTKQPFYVSLVDENDNLYPLSIEDGQQIVAIKLLINPASVNFNMSKIVNRSKTMVGWVEDHWGEELDTVSLSGSSAAFVLGEVSNVRDISMGTKSPQEFNTDDIGLTVKRRRETIGYKEFRRLIQIMNSNASDFDASTGFVTTRRFVKLSFEYAAMMGYFESFDTTEDASSPFKFTYQITYKAERTLFSYMK